MYIFYDFQTGMEEKIQCIFGFVTCSCPVAELIGKLKTIPVDWEALSCSPLDPEMD